MGVCFSSVGIRSAPEQRRAAAAWVAPRCWVASGAGDGDRWVAKGGSSVPGAGVRVTAGSFLGPSSSSPLDTSPLPGKPPPAGGTQARCSRRRGRRAGAVPGVLQPGRWRSRGGSVPQKLEGGGRGAWRRRRCPVNPIGVRAGVPSGCHPSAATPWAPNRPACLAPKYLRHHQIVPPHPKGAAASPGSSARGGAARKRGRARTAGAGRVKPQPGGGEREREGERSQMLVRSLPVIKRTPACLSPALCCAAKRQTCRFLLRALARSPRRLSSLLPAPGARPVPARP